MMTGRIRRALGELFRAGPSEPHVDRREEDYPAAYPSGWYRMCSSDALKPGAVMSMNCLGRELVIFRGRHNRVASVVDAHCPHQGANLGVGGVVKDDCIRCPFHHWSFDTSGRVRAIPELTRLPRISLGAWPTCERYGIVWFYYDAAKPHGPAPYELDELDDVVSGKLVHRGDLEAGEVDMHIIEFAENSVDFQHFRPVHGDMLVPWTQTKIPLVKVQHDPSWEIDSEQPHIAYFHNNASLTVLGREIPRSAATATITLFGPGGVVWFRFNIPDVGEIVMFQTHTPLAPLRQQVTFRWYAEPKIPRPLVSYVVGSWVSNWRADIAIWENKVYRRKPMLCRTDGPVALMRNWYQQFYPAA